MSEQPESESPESGGSAPSSPELPAPPLAGGSAPSTPPPELEAPVRRRLSGKRIALCVTGSIAAYKSALLLRLLRKEMASVEVILSHSAEKFIGPATFSGL